MKKIQKSLFENKNNWKTKKLTFPKSTIRVGSLFSGIGAFEQALKILKLKTKIVFACDNDLFAKKSFLANYKMSEKNWYDDVLHIKGAKYKDKIDLLVGGAPCQSFSMVGKRKGLNDDRGNLSLHFIKKINEIKPKVFIFENVRGLVNHDKGNTWRVIQNVFNDLGYSINSKILIEL